MLVVTTVIAVLTISLLGSRRVGAIEGWPELTLQPIAAGFNQPILATGARDGSGRLFVAEKDGAIRIVRAGQIVRT